jgi:cysteine synthase
MAVKKLVLVSTVLAVLIGYWLSCPVPDGYSPESTRTLRIMGATTKLIRSVVKDCYVSLHQLQFAAQRK